MSAESRVPIGRFLVHLAVVLGVVLAAGSGFVRFVAAPRMIDGASMSPTLMPGDRVVVDRWSYRWRPPRPGEIAVVRGPEGVALVKRVAARRPSESDAVFDVVGDNRSASLDSRSFGPLTRDRFDGRVLWRYWPPARAGSIR